MKHLHEHQELEGDFDDPYGFADNDEGDAAMPSTLKRQEQKQEKNATANGSAASSHSETVGKDDSGLELLHKKVETLHLLP